MATNSFSSSAAHSSDADFRAWVSGMSAGLDALGVFPKSTDSGQINLATATRPGANAYGGYEIRYLDDSMHSTAPIYVRIDYGTGGGATIPAVKMTVGKGSNGSGTITSPFFSGVRQDPDAAFAAGTYQSYMCGVDGFVGMLYLSGASSYGFCGFIIQRTVDNTGAPNSDGLAVFVGRTSPVNYAPELRSISYSTGVVLTTGNNNVVNASYNLKPFGDRSVIYGTPPKYQVYRNYCAIPNTRPLVGTISTAVANAFAPGTTFSIAAVGTTPRTYMVLPTQLGYAGYDRLAMLWE